MVAELLLALLNVIAGTLAVIAFTFCLEGENLLSFTKPTSAFPVILVAFTMGTSPSPGKEIKSYINNYDRAVILLYYSVLALSVVRIKR